MKINRYMPIGFIYVQGLSFLNPIYLLLILKVFSTKKKLDYNALSVICFMLLMLAQAIAFKAHPHSLPLSAVGTVFGLWFFTLRPTSVIDLRQYVARCQTHKIRNVIFFVMFLLLVDSFPRLPYILMNWRGWEDYELKEAVKKSTFLADDTNTLAIRLVILYFVANIYCSLSRHLDYLMHFAFLILMAATYSRAGIMALLFLLFGFKYFFRLSPRRLLVIVGAGLAGLILFLPKFWSFFVDASVADSSVISKFDLIFGSLDFWISAGLFEKLFGLGYFSNLDVGLTQWASGHAILYYFLVELGLVGALLLVVLLFNAARSKYSKLLVATYLVLGFSVFRFDFVFLYLGIALIEARLGLRSERKFAPRALR